MIRYERKGESFFSRALFKLLKEDNSEIQLVEQLIEWGANVNYADENGNTALHQICLIENLSNKYEMPITNVGDGMRYYQLNPAQFIFLVEKGALMSNNNQGENPIDFLDNYNVPMNFFSGYGEVPFYPLSKDTFAKDIKIYLEKRDTCRSILLRSVTDK